MTAYKLTKTMEQERPEWLKAAKRVRFNAANINDAVTAAARVSLSTGSPVFLFSTYQGYTLTNETPELPGMSKYYRVTVDAKTVKAELWSNH